VESTAREFCGNISCGLPECLRIDHFFRISASFSRIFISRPRGTG
jgi:hypothetical protein